MGEVAEIVAENELVKPASDCAAARIPVMVPGNVFWDVKLNGAADVPEAVSPM